MCKGTRCTHDSDPAVEYLECTYDAWEFKEIPLFEEGDFRAGAQPAAYLVRVMGRRTNPDAMAGMRGGPGHDQAMIKLKDDLGRYVDATDEMFNQALWCSRCPDGSHKCYNCGSPLSHMAVGTCPECWWTEEDTGLLQTVRGLVA